MVVPGLIRADEKVVTEGSVTTYIGELSGAPESARIAFVVEGEKFVAYVCSSDQEFNDLLSRWCRGDVKDGKLSAKAPCGAEVTAAVTAESITGTLKKQGKSHEFTARAIAGDANAGLFRGCVLTNSHSTRRSRTFARTFARSTPCSGPGVNCSTMPASVRTVFGLSHQPPTPSSVEMASYTVAAGAAIQTW